MNCYRLIIGMVLAMCTINGLSAEPDSGTQKEPAGQQSGGAVIEYRDQVQERSAEEGSVKSSTTSAGGTSVELIVGGSGEDGVAKRTEMPVRK